MRTDNPPNQRDMLVATQSFTALYDGERVEITAGVDCVAPDHPIVRDYPEKFGLKPVSPNRDGKEKFPSPSNGRTGKTAGQSSRTAGPTLPDDDYLPPPTWSLGFSAPLHRTGELPDLSSTVSPTVVKLSRHALDGLQAATRAVPRTHETGGLLVGLRPCLRSRSDAASTKVIEAHPPGPSSLLGRSTFGLDFRVEHGKIKDRVLAGHEIAVCGAWHSHPGGPTGPSTADLRVWANAWSHANGTACGIVDRYVGLIVTGVGEAQGLGLTPWVIRRKRWHGLVAEPAELEVVD